jgi:hypothetical protein
MNTPTLDYLFGTMLSNDYGTGYITKGSILIIGFTLRLQEK